MADYLQIAFYIASPIGTFLAVFTAYYAIYRQTKPAIVIYYEPNIDTASKIDLVISNIGTGTARDISFSEPLPIRCWGVEKADKSDIHFVEHDIPFLAPGREIRFAGGQYGGLSAQIGDGIEVLAEYTFRTPLQSSKRGVDLSVLNIHYMQHLSTKNSAAYDLSDALKGRNHTIFLKMNKSLDGITQELRKLVSEKGS
ncbi:hypothetical protein [Salinibius halmophilus]|uniref:hypothetical protein n=1 Tax=Salinibius halmophilus TaxID=1853216 RepID=UPI000E663ACF|nr:hypothetical protein [Salinibius halmophilus]